MRECGFEPDISRTECLDNCYGPAREKLFSFLHQELTSPSDRSSALNLLYQLTENGIISEDSSDAILDKAYAASEYDINDCFRQAENEVGRGNTYNVATSLFKLKEYHQNGFDVSTTRLKSLCERILELYKDGDELHSLADYEPSPLRECAEELLKEL